MTLSPIMIKPTVLLLQFIVVASVYGEDLAMGLMRKSESKAPCYLFSAGATESHTIQLDYECSFNYHTGDSFFNSHFTNFKAIDSPNPPKSLGWLAIENDIEVETTILAIRNDKRIVRYVYHKRGDPSSAYGFILVRESARGWCRPFLIAQTEWSLGRSSFDTMILSEVERPLAVTATLRKSGTGEQRSHIHIDLSAQNPKLIRTATVPIFIWEAILRMMPTRDTQRMADEESKATGR